ncbi:RDD family protein [Luteimonas sp. MJ293]|uniref:RDD family protein n=1 Tax=Luteimonas sp. MJ146 TaxID=3129240 RepID=UPI0031BAC804
MMEQDFEYVGFWARVGAAIIDSILIMLVTVPLIIMVYGWAYFDSTHVFIAGPADFLISWVLPAVAVILFWLRLQATPGKMAVSARVVDAKTGESMSAGQAVIRYVAYFASTIPLLIGIIWVAFDPKKQGWHDKIAGTVVIRPQNRGPEPVRFDGAG